MNHRVTLIQIKHDLYSSVRMVLEQIGLLDDLTPSMHVELKPNFTYRYYKPGVTTSPALIRETVKILREYTDRIAIVETDGGYGVWQPP